jgi:hypothetical protein
MLRQTFIEPLQHRRPGLLVPIPGLFIRESRVDKAKKRAGPVCVWAIDTSVTLKAPMSQSIDADGRARARFRRTPSKGYSIHLRPATVTAAPGVPSA